MEIDDKFLKEMGLENLSPEEKDQALKNIFGTLNNRLGERIGELVDDDRAADFSKLVDNGVDEEQLSEWLSENVPNYNQLVEEELTKMRDQALASVDQFKAWQKQNQSDTGDGQNG